MAKVMFDIDGVLRDFSTGWRNLVEDVHGERPPDSTSWYYLGEYAEAELNMSKEDFNHWLFVKNGYTIMRRSPAYKGAIEAWDEIRRVGHHITVVTDQKTQQTMDGTFRWLSDRNMVPDKLVFSSIKWCNAHFYIEDRQSTLKELANLADTWTTTVVGIRRPWNDPDSIKGVRAVSSVAEYPSIIEEVTNGIRHNCGLV